MATSGWCGDFFLRFPCELQVTSNAKTAGAQSVTDAPSGGSEQRMLPKLNFSIPMATLSPLLVFMLEATLCACVRTRARACVASLFVMLEQVLEQVPHIFHLFRMPGYTCMPFLILCPV